MTLAQQEELTLDGPHGPLTVRVYAPDVPAGPGLVWLHAGGFAGGDPDMPEADWVAAQFARRGVTVASVDYQRGAGIDLDLHTERGTRHGHLNQPDHPGATASIDRFAARILALSHPSSAHLSRHADATGRS
ncbi:hypothetical protein [Microbacterium deminutum]|uniref:Alpha/beta hydrolase fold-3 domain-containing protein n=1 Tax=Microbacterium deminutum TaxID=344164 RepID=A0ABN2QRS0_9MICO